MLGLFLLRGEGELGVEPPAEVDDPVLPEEFGALCVCGGGMD